MTASFVIRKTFDGKYVIMFLLNGYIDNSVPGTYGTGCKVYETSLRCWKAGNRYLDRMRRNGFDVIKGVERKRQRVI